jgi:uncharacterized protein YfaT (DUF1175 family)
MRRFPLAALLVVVFAGSLPVVAQVHLQDEGDRAAFRSWFVFLADARFYRQAPEITDCAALVRYAFREALRTHSPEWVRHADLPLIPSFADVRRPPHPRGDYWPLFRVDGARFAEFADAATIVRFNARLVTRDPVGARPGDLLFFHQSEDRGSDHLMVFVGRSLFEQAGEDWIVYHTGPDTAPTPGTATGRSRIARPGEMRKVRMSELVRHPSPRWRPLPDNPAFAGVFRLAVLW